MRGLCIGTSEHVLQLLNNVYPWSSYLMPSLSFPFLLALRSTCKSRAVIIYVHLLPCFLTDEIDVDLGVSRPLPLRPTAPLLAVSYLHPDDHDQLALQCLSEIPLHLIQ